MNGALIENGVCINVAVFEEDDIETMNSFGYIHLPNGYGIDDLYDAETDTWSKAPQPEPEEPIETEPTDTEVLNTLLGVTNNG